METKKITINDFILPIIIIALSIGYGYYVLTYPVDTIVSNYLSLPLIFKMVRQHFYLILVSASLAIATSVPLGILLSRPMFKRLRSLIVGIVNVGQTIPSLAVIALFVGILGIGSKTAIFALWMYSLLPILNNTIAGMTGVSPFIIDSAIGMGMTKVRTLFFVELPIALPVIMAGIRTAVVINVATAVIAAYVGAGGLGDFIIAGKNINRWQILLLGAGYASLIALLLDHILGVVERILTQ